MRVSIIVAVAKNGVIGRKNNLVWRLRDDMKFFSDTTRGHTVITGRKNYESIPEKYRPLPNRSNIVVTRNTDFVAPGSHVVHSLAAAMEYAADIGTAEAFIIGGGEIYRQALERLNVERVLLTHVNAEPEGDTFFELDSVATGWHRTSLGEFRADDRNEHGFEIVEYSRVDS
ncbi:MAG: diacylglycerol kinase [Crocinitomicaceae bacterium]|nr:diacylglycerol kinase [Crocinitomicaceae bacterium]|tara:strand:- start:4861 stop:5376 length:516 start_codon:yes stop_codon:yes gene_type:complete